MIRTWADIDQDSLTPAEIGLIDACKQGAPCVLGDGRRPEAECTDPKRTIRADLLRYLILGGCKETAQSRITALRFKA